MTASQQPAVLATGLTKRFGDVLAVHELDLRVPAGCVYGFLGPNGAGKTTTVRILATLLRPDEGSAYVLGYDVARQSGAVREHISLTGQFAALDTDLTGRENLRLIARLHGHRTRAARERAEELLAAVELTDAASRPVKGYSGGMLRRLDIAAALTTRPQVLFLDEPTTGLDPVNRARVWQVIRSLAADGTSILLTTQYLEEADHLAERIAVIDHGRLIAEGSPAELKAAAGPGALHLHLADPAQRESAARVLAEALGSPVRPAAAPDGLAVSAPDPANAAAAVTALAAAGIAVSSFALRQPSLDEVFLTLTGAAPAAAAAPTAGSIR